jgi:hypothetical protein
MQQKNGFPPPYLIQQSIKAKEGEREPLLKQGIRVSGVPSLPRQDFILLFW